MRRGLMVLTMLLGLLPLTSYAANYYVSKASGASDSNNGTSQTFVSGTNGPWLTLGKVASVNFSAGDTVSFRCGDTWTGEQFTTVSTGGSSDSNRLTFTNYGTCTGTNRPIFNFTGQTWGAVFTDKNWVTIDGFEMHSSFNEVFNVGLQTSSGTSTGFTIKNSRFHTTTDTSGSSPTRAIVSLLNFVWGTGSPIAEGHLTNLVLENNDIGGNTTHNGLSINGGVFDVIIRDNHIHHAPHACIDIKQNQNSSQRNRRFQILRNEVDNCETGIFTVESSDILDDQNIVHDGVDDPLNAGAPVAIKTHNVGFGATDNLRVQRNIVYNFPSGGQGISFDGCVDCESWNNTLYNVTTPRHFGSNANTNLAELNNLIYSSGADNTAGFDGRFANAAGGDFRLCTALNIPVSGCAGASNAINAGSASPPVASNSTTMMTAAANYTCNGNCDLGALETAPATTTPIAHWPFNESGTSTFTAADATGLGHTGTLYDGTTASAQGPTWIAGRSANALHCDGSNDNVQVAHAADINITGDMSIVTWLRLVSTTNLSTNAVVLTKTTNSDETPWHIELNTPGAPHFSWYHHNTAGDFSSSLSFTGYTIPSNTWIYAMFVRTITSPARTVALYINGSTTPVQSLTWTSADDPQASTGPMRICANETRNSARYANIDLDDTHLYPVALTGAEFAALYATFGVPGAPTNLRMVTQ